MKPATIELSTIELRPALIFKLGDADPSTIAYTGASASYTAHLQNGHTVHGEIALTRHEMQSLALLADLLSTRISETLNLNGR